MRNTLIALALLTSTHLASATPWTYRGTLNDGGQPANGPYDLRLTLINATGTASASLPITLYDVMVKDGSFAAEVDFGFDLSRLPMLKLKTEVQQNGSGFSSLGEPTNFDPKAALAGVCWDTSGNVLAPGDFLGSTNNTQLVFKASGSSVVRIDGGLVNGTTNIVAGSASNTIDSGDIGQTISGGGNSTNINTSLSSYTTIGGGWGNIADGAQSTIGGGQQNRTGSDYGTVAGGRANRASGLSSAIGGGDQNRAEGNWSVVAGGENNYAAGEDSFVAGGSLNLAGADNSFAGGLNARVRIAGNPPATLPPGVTAADYTGIGFGDSGSFVWVGSDFLENFRSSGRNQFLVRASGGVGINTNQLGGAGLTVAQPNSVNSGNNIVLRTSNKTATWTISEIDGRSQLIADGGDLELLAGPNKNVRGRGGLSWSGTGIDSTTSPAYTHLVSASNTCDGGSGTANSRTYLNHPLLNNNPNAVVLFSANFGSLSNGSAPPRNPLAIYYSNVASGTCPAGRWVIYQTTVTSEAMNNNSRYNIWFVLP